MERPVKSLLSNEFNEQEKYEREEGEIVYSVGNRLEAQDQTGRWYPARVEQVSANNVYVHFERWSTKYDEWIPMESGRLRDVRQALPKRKKKTFVEGEAVTALWSAYQKYQGVISKVLPDEKYEVLFDDGYCKTLPGSRIWHQQGDKMSSLNQLGSKQDRRDRKRKINVAELFRAYKKPKALAETPDKKPEPRSSTVSTPPQKVSRLPVSNERNLSVEESESQSSSTSPIPPQYPTPPVQIQVQRYNGGTETWFKSFTRRMEGKTAGKVEILITTATGKKLRSRTEVVRYCDDHKIIFNPDSFEFSTKARSKLKLPKSESAISSPVNTGLANIVSPVEVSITEPVEEEKKFIGDFEVIVEDGQFICPLPECRKHFRKENLLHMHMKHYHPAMTKFLDYTPSVTDLAYARTKSNIDEGGQVPSPRGGGRLSQRTSEGERLVRRPVEKKASPVQVKDCRVDLKPLLPMEVEGAAAPAGEPEPGAALPVSVAEVSAHVAIPETVTATAEGVETPTPTSPSVPDPAIPVVSERPKISWKRRSNLHDPKRKLHPPDWYGRIGRPRLNGPIAGTSVGNSLDDAGKQSGDIVQRNPILNTLLSSRSLAPPRSALSWRSGWRRGRRGGRHRYRRRPLTARRSSPPPLSPQPLPQDLTEEDSKGGSIVEGFEEIRSPTDEAVKLERLRRHEIINCICQIKEEDGLMIQCDVCLCWQHGHCLGISRQTGVPDAYVCKVCKDPPRGRPSQKYCNHQDWIKEGVLPSLSTSSKDEEMIARRQELLKRSFDLSGQLTLITRLLHTLRTKLLMSRSNNHPKLWLWAKRWIEKKEEPVAEVKQEEDPQTPKAPEPEKAIEPMECRLNLLEHISNYQLQVESRLASLEAQIAELEASQDDATVDEPIEKCPRTKAGLIMLLRDLQTVNKVATLPQNQELLPPMPPRKSLN